MEALRRAFPSATWVLTTLAIAVTLVGIAPAQILLALALLSFILQRAFPLQNYGGHRTGDLPLHPSASLAVLNGKSSSTQLLQRSRRLNLLFPPIKAPLLLFMGFTVLSFAFSPERAIGRAPLNKFWLFAILLIVASEFNIERIRKTYFALFWIGGLAASFTVIQYFFLARNTIRYRVTGFMGHWMTLSGEMMLVVTCLAGFLVFAPGRRRLHEFLLLVLMSFALALTMTRSVWIATLLGLALLLLMRHLHWRTLLVFVLAFIAISVLAPDTFQRRIGSIFNPRDPSNYARSAIWAAGLRMVETHPWLGVGPQRVSRVFYDYHPHPEDRFRDGFFPVHLHNNLLQFAAERGIPCALAWLWLMLKLGADHWRRFRRENPSEPGRVIAAIGFSSVVVLFIAGMFEFNFGDSEVLMIFLFLVSAPYAACKQVQGTGD